MDPRLRGDDEGWCVQRRRGDHGSPPARGWRRGGAAVACSGVAFSQAEIHLLPVPAKAPGT